MNLIRILIISDGKYGDRAIEIIKSKIPNTEIFYIPERDPHEMLDEVELSEELIKKISRSELIITYIRHPDVTLEICDFNIPVLLAINFGQGFFEQAKEINDNVFMPISMCQLIAKTGIGAIDEYSKYFGLPNFDVKLDTTKNPSVIERVDLMRQSPCGATNRTIKSLVGKKVEPETFNQFGLNVSQECREPMSVILKRAHMGDSAAEIHRLNILESLYKKYPEQFNRNGQKMLIYLKDVRNEFFNPKKNIIYR